MGTDPHGWDYITLLLGNGKVFAIRWREQSDGPQTSLGGMVPTLPYRSLYPFVPDT